MGLTNKQRVFISEYLKCWNASAAALKAGYSEKTAYAIGWENLKKPEIAAEIEARIEQHKMSADEVLSRLADQARGDIADFIRPIDMGNRIDFTLDLKKAMEQGKTHLIKKIKRNAEGHLEIELYDAQSALVQLGKANGALSVAGESEDKPFVVKVVRGVSTDDI